jgi:hypothetical protein
MISGIIDELLDLATGLGCEFPPNSKDTIISTMKVPSAESNSVMYQDYLSRRPMEIETFLGSPLKLAKKIGLTLGRLEVVYALLHDKNQKNLKGELPPSPGPNHSLPPRTSSIANGAPGARPMMNGKGRQMGGSRAPSLTGPPPAMRRGPYVNGYRNGSMPNGFPPNGGPYNGRRDSTEGENLEEFSHVMLFENTDGNFQDGSSGSFGDGSGGTGTPSSSELALRERELALRQREIELKEREQHMHMRRGPPPRRQGRPAPGVVYDDEDDEDDYFDPMSGGGRPVDDNIDMMSITSRRHRKTPSSNHHQQQQQQQPPSSRGSNLFARKNRSSTRLMSDIPSPHESIMRDPLMGYSSNRYGGVDRQALGDESRHNSMAGSKMEDMAARAANGPYPGMRRLSHSPGNPLSPPANRPSPPNGHMNGMRPPGPPMMNGGPMPRQGMSRGIGPQPVEQHVGVSTSLFPPKPNHQVRNLTGSASASAPSGDSASANTGSANSAASSSSSLQPRKQSLFQPPEQIVVIPR